MWLQRVVVLETQAAMSSTQRVLNDHLIASDVSKDLRAMSSIRRQKRIRAPRPKQTSEPSDGKSKAVQ